MFSSRSPSAVTSARPAASTPPWNATLTPNNAAERAIFTIATRYSIAGTLYFTQTFSSCDAEWLNQTGSTCSL